MTDFSNTVKLFERVCAERDIGIKERKIPDPAQEPKDRDIEIAALRAENATLREIIKQQREPDRAWRMLAAIDEILDKDGEVES